MLADSMKSTQTAIHETVTKAGCTLHYLLENGYFSVRLSLRGISAEKYNHRSAQRGPVVMKGAMTLRRVGVLDGLSTRRRESLPTTPLEPCPHATLAHTESGQPFRKAQASLRA